MSTMYVRGYLQGSENGRVVTIVPDPDIKQKKSEGSRVPDYIQS